MSGDVEAFVGLGANIGDAAGTLRHALRSLQNIDGIRVLAQSSLYRTPAWGVTEQPDFVNAVARIGTRLSATRLLDVLLQLERDAGRERAQGVRWGPRELDLDLLLYGNQRIDAPGLRVPHPHLHERAFVLVPLVEIAPDLVVPGQGRVASLAAQVPGAGIEALR